jgi:hypothetical protein
MVAKSERKNAKKNHQQILMLPSDFPLLFQGISEMEMNKLLRREVTPFFYQNDGI